ncbi:MAG: (d)CMP kinase, partial [Muribaculaceae bacterium]|nr:(d)CMP kinase [Muribaculaceae bacterium]
MRNRLIVITGPTGSGKSALAMRMAGEIGCDIISADSRQMYREIPIGTAARRSREEWHEYVSLRQLAVP